MSNSVDPKAGDNLSTGVPMGMRVPERAAVTTPTTARAFHLRRFRRAAHHLMAVIERRWKYFPGDLARFEELGRMRDAWLSVMQHEAEMAGIEVANG